MTAPATARMTIGSVLGTVTSAATSVSSVFDTTTKGINMLNRMVSDAAEQQHIRSIVNKDEFINRLQEEKAMEHTTRQISIVEFRNQSENHSKLYDQNYDRIGNLLKQFVSE